MVKKITTSSVKKIKEEDIINGYKVGNLKLVVQGVPDKKTGRIIKGVFCDLNVEDENEKKQRISFVFTLNSVPEFKKHILSMINESILLHIESKNKKNENKG